MRKLVGAAIALTTVVYALIVQHERSLERADAAGYRNVKACTKLRPGITEADLVRIFGAPEGSEERAGVRHLAFHTLAEAASPISADVDAAGGRVLALRCAGAERPAWVAGR
jgi:hypothetical protein